MLKQTTILTNKIGTNATKQLDTLNKNFNVSNYNIDKETFFSFTWFITAFESDAFFDATDDKSTLSSQSFPNLASLILDHVQAELFGR